MVKIERDREEKKRLKELKEKQIRQKREARKKKFIEAAYDGNMTEITYLIDDLQKELEELTLDQAGLIQIDEGKRKQAVLSLIDCRDKNNNTPLSEAAAGGNSDVVKFLLTHKANPNSRGMFGRTPIWRAAFAGHLNCVQLLLENGADPRLYTQDGQRSIDATTNETIRELLNNWNISLTERMLAQIEKHHKELKKEQIAGLDVRKRAARDEYVRVKREFEHVKNELFKVSRELQRLHDEYLLNEKMYGELIEKKEPERASLQVKYEDLREKVTKTRIAYKDLWYEIRNEKKDIKKAKLDEADTETKKTTNSDDSENEDDKQDQDSDQDSDGEAMNSEEKMVKINIKEMDDVVLRDLTDVIKNSVDKWPLIIDTNELAATFLRYRDTNYVNCLDMQNGMKPEKFRLALIGAIRYGKPFVLDLMQYDQELLESLKTVCAMITRYSGNLFDDMCNKKILINENYMKLVDLDKDGKEYAQQNFNQTRLKSFKVIFITSNPYPGKWLSERAMPIKVVTTQKFDPFDDF